MKKVAILTGFKAFGDYKVNPTEILANHLDGGVLAKHRIHSFVFPTWVLSPDGHENHAETILNEALKFGAAVIISLGIASEVKGIRIEGRATNWVENKKYCTPLENGKPIFSNYKDKEVQRVPFGRWNFPKMHMKFQTSGIPFEHGISQDAGTYCCNALMYRILRTMKNANINLPFLFAHVPCTEESIAGISDFDRKKILVTQEQLVETVSIMLESYTP